MQFFSHYVRDHTAMKCVYCTYKQLQQPPWDYPSAEANTNTRTDNARHIPDNSRGWDEAKHAYVVLSIHSVMQPALSPQGIGPQTFFPREPFLILTS